MVFGFNYSFVTANRDSEFLGLSIQLQIVENYLLNL